MIKFHSNTYGVRVYYFNISDVLKCEILFYEETDRFIIKHFHYNGNMWWELVPTLSGEEFNTYSNGIAEFRKLLLLK